MIGEGIYLDLSSSDYHSDKNSISRTALMDFKKSPRKYWAKHLNPNRPIEESKPSWEFGTAFHTLILEPHLFEQQYFVLPEKVKLKDVGRVAYDAYKEIEKQAESTQLHVLSQNDYKKLSAMQDSLYSNARAKELIEDAIYESSYFWKDKSSGLMVKSRPDIIQGNIYIDLKTIDDASPQNYQREMAKYGYHTQGAIVKDGCRILENRIIKACINICIEKQYPYCVATYIIDDAAIEAGHVDYKNQLLALKHSRVYNEYQDYELQIISLPTWATK
jgi:hypothetical protein